MPSFAYEFSCDKTLYQMETLLNQAGEWKWIVRDCHWYPDFLQCRPIPGTRICIYVEKPPDGKTLHSLIETNSETPRSQIEPTFLNLLEKLAVKDLSEIPPCPWPFD